MDPQNSAKLHELQAMLTIPTLALTFLCLRGRLMMRWYQQTCHCLRQRHCLRLSEQTVTWGGTKSTKQRCLSDFPGNFPKPEYFGSFCGEVNFSLIQSPKIWGNSNSQSGDEWSRWTLPRKMGPSNLESWTTHFKNICCRYGWKYACSFFNHHQPKGSTASSHVLFTILDQQTTVSSRKLGPKPKTHVLGGCS